VVALSSRLLGNLVPIRPRLKAASALRWLYITLIALHERMPYSICASRALQRPLVAPISSKLYSPRFRSISPSMLAVRWNRILNSQGALDGRLCRAALSSILRHLPRVLQSGYIVRSSRRDGNFGDNRADHHQRDAFLFFDR
jgi:hypothetical protein